MLAIASDHGGFALKGEIIKYLEKKGIDYKDYGTYDESSVDYPTYAEAAANAVRDGICDKGILVCGTGIGISIAANKVRGIRCALCSEPVSAALSRQHNNANMLALGGRTIGTVMALEIVETWLNTDFLSDQQRHVNRVNMISEIENKQ